jgi:hypothetical protein
MPHPPSGALPAYILVFIALLRAFSDSFVVFVAKDNGPGIKTKLIIAEGSDEVAGHLI